MDKNDKTNHAGDEKTTESSYDVLLEFAYFIEKQQSESLSVLLQRVSISFAANIALLGFYITFLNNAVQKFNKIPYYIYIVVAVISIAPILILLYALLLLAKGIYYQPHVSVDPNKIISLEYEKKSPDEIKRELAASYRRDWSDNQSIRDKRSNYFNTSVKLSFTALLIMVILFIISIFYRG